MNYEEKIAKLEAARAAVEAAKAACEAVGVAASTCGSERDVFDLLAARIAATRTSAERQQLPIDIGGWVEISNGFRGWVRWKIADAKAKWLTIGGMKFDRATGQMKNGTGYGRHIHPDDLARINRDLPAKRGAR